MKSEIKFVTPSLKISAVLGFFATILIIVMAVLFRFEFGLILLSVAGTVGVTGILIITRQVMTLSHDRQLSKLELETKRQQLRIVTFEADRKELESGVISIPKTHRIVTASRSAIDVIEALPDGVKMAALPATSQQVLELLPETDTIQRCLIVGASDAGKTTLLQWIISRRLAVSTVIVIDPHAYPGKWPKGVKVVGTGRDYPGIEAALLRLVQLMTERYEEIGRGTVAEGQHAALSIFIDEWRAIVQNTDSAASCIKTLLTESRKAAMSVFVATHSERVKALGIEGEGDLKDGFAIIRLAVINGQRQATLDYGNGEIEAILPGRFVESGQSDFIAGDYIDLEPVEPEPEGLEAEIVELWDAGITDRREIAKRSIGIGGNQYRRIDEVLSKFGRV